MTRIISDDELADVISNPGKFGDVMMSNIAAELQAARIELSEIREATRHIMAEECAPDEKHCTCVPALRAELAKYVRVAQAEQSTVLDAWIRRAGLAEKLSIQMSTLLADCFCRGCGRCLWCGQVHEHVENCRYLLFHMGADATRDTDRAWLVLQAAHGQALRERDALQAHIETDERLLNARNELLKAIPACPEHGDQCVSHLKLQEHENERFAGKYFAPTQDRQQLADAIAEWLTGLRENITGRNWFVGEWSTIQYPDGGCIIAFTFDR